MILLIKNRMRFFAVCDPNGKIIYKIKNKRLWNADKIILNSENQTIYTVSKTVAPGAADGGTVRYLIRHPDEKAAIATASLIYTGDRQTIYQLPKVCELVIDSMYGNLDLSRSKGDIFLIKAHESIIGKIDAHRMFHPAVLTCNGIEDPGFLSALFVLTRYMQHEDDLIVV